MDAGNLVRTVRLDAGLTQRGLAQVAEVSQSTVARIESGTMSPTVAMLERLVSAAGHRLDTTTVPDRRGVTALAGGVDWLASGDPATIEPRLLARLATSGAARPDGTVLDPVACLFAVADQAPIFDRPGATRFVADSAVEFLRRAIVGDATTVVTCTFAAVRTAPIVTPVFAVVYVDDGDLDRVATTGQARPVAPTEPANIVLVPSDATVARHSEPADGVRWATPWRAAADAATGNGRMPNVAAAVARRLTADRMAA